MNNATFQVRRPAVAGIFYPEDATQLRRKIARYLRESRCAGPYPKALIVPHAGYAYSGTVAAAGYSLVEPIREMIQRVVLLGPSHRVPFYGLATSAATVFETPLGSVPIDERLVDAACKLPQVHVMDEAHEHEHSLEVQLPFLQMTIQQFSLVPLVVGDARPHEVCEVLEALWDDRSTLIVVSSDLSHYRNYSAARSIDSETAHLIERRQWLQLSEERACGYLGICGLLQLGSKYGWKVQIVDLRNSGDTSGNMEQVVGYGSFVLY